jgi:anti-sigma regulatory factor (Ser/Thr protein kinase)
LGKIYQMTRAADLESLADLRGLIDTACLDFPEVDDQTRYDLKLAVDEACTNIIQHGYAGMNPGSIIFQLEMDSSRACITLTDFGHAFEPGEAPQPDLEAALEDRPAPDPAPAQIPRPRAEEGTGWTSARMRSMVLRW